MPRIAASSPRGLFARLVFWIARRQLGKVPTSLTVVAHNKQIFKGHVNMERAQLGAKHLDRNLKDLVSLRVATLIGCPF